jgi:hypothetical protein
MKSKLIIACAALALAACGQSTAPTEEAPAAPQSLMEQVQAMSAEMQPVTAYQHLVAYQQAHPEVQPPCTAPRDTASRGVIPDTVAPDSIYAQHIGSLVMSVQCGVLISRAAYDPREHWLVIYAPGATEAAIVNCAGPNGADVCPREVPRAAAPAAPATP